MKINILKTEDIKRNEEITIVNEIYKLMAFFSLQKKMREAKEIHNYALENVSGYKRIYEELSKEFGGIFEND